jgi:hypothetical protein
MCERIPIELETSNVLLMCACVSQCSWVFPGHPQVQPKCRANSAQERLRFAQNSRSNALNELPIQNHHTKSASIADRRGKSLNLIEPRRSASSSRRLRRLARQQSVSSNEASWFLTLPEKIKKKQFTREEQVILAARLRESVILDAADEAIYKASRRASRNLTPLFDLSNSTSRASFETYEEADEEYSEPTMSAMYESFRWMDEEKDLDLKLVLDDYHANLDGVVLPTPESITRPSFRRQMSISKMPFGRSSMSSIHPRPSKSDTSPAHNRQKSRTLSLIAPKHIPKSSVSSIDPNAAHYQDPEARLKLRVYLASPQKFDEAIEFGFPSIEAVADGVDKENKPPRHNSKDTPRADKSFSTDRGHSFLNDDTASLFEDDVSMADPESPLTPLGADLGFGQNNRGTGPSISKGSKASAEYLNAMSTRLTVVKQAESYSQAMAGSREMTLRMTLTRPDLRADENIIYGRQISKRALREEHFPYIDEKYEVKGPLGGLDGWGALEKENGVVKRLWNRVSRSQKKVH